MLACVKPLQLVPIGAADQEMQSGTPGEDTKYCTAAGHGTSKLVASNAYGWQCTSPAAAVDTNVACNLLYHVSDALSRFAVFASPYSWQCWN